MELNRMGVNSAAQVGEIGLAKPDYSTPQKTFQTWWEAAKNNNLNLFESCYLEVSGEKPEKLDKEGHDTYRYEMKMAGQQMKAGFTPQLEKDPEIVEGNMQGFNIKDGTMEFGLDEKDMDAAMPSYFEFVKTPKGWFID